MPTRIERIHRLLRLTDVLFMIGSACFALGSVPGYASAVGADATGMTYFIGSIFFTTAGYLQYLLASNPSTDRPFRLFGIEAHDFAWWGAAVQLFGTLCFNASTFHALTTTWSAQEANQKIWRPDIYGSIAFLVASSLIVAVARRSTDPPLAAGKDRAWWVAMINLAGSVFFMASALAAFVVPSTGDLLNASLDNSGTLLGALCFLAAAAIEHRGDPLTARTGRLARVLGHDHRSHT